MAEEYKRSSEDILKSLEEDLKFYLDPIREVALEILEKGISKYPVFIAHELEVAVGEVILDKNDFGKSWSINATVIEELSQNNIIQEEKMDEFRKVYKDPKKFVCIFLISEKGGNFIFYPYKNTSRASMN